MLRRSKDGDERLKSRIDAMIRTIPYPLRFWVVLMLALFSLAVVVVLARQHFGLLGVAAVSVPVVLLSMLTSKKAGAGSRTTSSVNASGQLRGRRDRDAMIRRIPSVLFTTGRIVVASSLFGVVYLLVFQNVGWLAALAVAVLIAPFFAWFVTMRKPGP